MGFPVDVSESTKASDLEGNQNQLGFRLLQTVMVVRQLAGTCCRSAAMLSADAGNVTQPGKISSLSPLLSMISSYILQAGKLCVWSLTLVGKVDWRGCKCFCYGLCIFTPLSLLGKILAV